MTSKLEQKPFADSTPRPEPLDAGRTPPQDQDSLDRWESEGGSITRSVHREPRAGRPSIASRSISPTPARAAFRWSWKLITIAGVDVHVHGTFLLLIAVLVFGDLLTGQGLAAMVGGAMLIAAVFASVVFHELGHALTARRFGIRTLDITLLPIGGVARLERMPEAPGQQLLVALAGPAVNVAIAGILYGASLLAGLPGAESFAAAGGAFLSQLLWINVSMAVFNLLPGYPMDGGRILRALLAMRMEPERATQVAARVGQTVAVALGCVGLLVSPLLVVIAVFVWLGAQAEHSMSRVTEALAGLSVRDGMITRFQDVSPTDPLSVAVDRALGGSQLDFPVMDGARRVGVLTNADLLGGLASGGPDLPVQDAMRDAPGMVRPSDALDRAMARMRQTGSRVLAVIEDDVLVGILTLENIGALLALTTASRRSDAAPAPSR